MVTIHMASNNAFSLSLPSSTNVTLNVMILHDKWFLFHQRNKVECASQSSGVLSPFNNRVYKWGSWKPREDSIAEGKGKLSLP